MTRRRPSPRSPLAGDSKAALKAREQAALKLAPRAMARPRWFIRRLARNYALRRGEKVRGVLVAPWRKKKSDADA